MPNVYQIAEQYRKALAKRESGAVKRLVASYKTVFDALNAEMAGILAGAKANPSSVYRARRMATFLAQAEAELLSIAPDAVDVVTAGQSDAVRDAVKAAVEQMKAVGVPIGAGVSATGGIEGFADRAVAAYVGTAGNGSPLTELFAAVSTDGAQIAHDRMLTALTLGFGLDRTGEMLKNAIGVSLTRAMTIARTESMRAYRGAHIGYLRENSEHIAGWVWHADHGWRTCPVCLAMDGTFHKLSEDFASHPNCRCSPVTVAKGEDGKSELPDRETGAEWFAKQSADEQRALLGPGKFALYKDGKIELADLVRVGKNPKWGPYRVERSLKSVEARLVEKEAKKQAKVEAQAKYAARKKAQAAAAKKAAEEQAAKEAAEKLAKLQAQTGVDPAKLKFLPESKLDDRLQKAGIAVPDGASKAEKIELLLQADANQLETLAKAEEAAKKAAKAEAKQKYLAKKKAEAEAAKKAAEEAKKAAEEAAQKALQLWNENHSALLAMSEDDLGEMLLNAGVLFQPGIDSQQKIKILLTQFKEQELKDLISAHNAVNAAQAAQAAADAAAAQAALDAQLAAEAAEAARAAASQSRGDVILHTRTGAAKGSNKGGFYSGRDGVKRYVKQYTDETQAWSEHAANEVYRRLGLQAPVSEVFEHEGVLYYASEIVDGAGSVSIGTLTEAQAQDFAHGLVADILTGNWDAVGATFDNILLTQQGVLRVDNGGTFLFRAMAGRKQQSALSKIDEVLNLFDSGVNPNYSAVMTRAGYRSVDDMAEDFVRQVRLLERVADDAGGWSPFLREVAPGLNAADRAEIENMLSARMAKLSAKADEFEQRLGLKVAPRPVTANAAEAEFAQDVQDAVDAGWQGKALRIDEEDIEDHDVMLFQEEMPDGRKRTGMTLKIRPEAEHKILDAITRAGGATTTGAADPLDPLRDELYDLILAAVKTVNTHAADGAYNVVTLEAMRAKQSQLLNMLLTGDQWDLELATHYLGWIKAVEDAVASRTAIVDRFEKAVLSPRKKAKKVKSTVGYKVKRGQPHHTKRRTQEGMSYVESDSVGNSSIYHGLQNKGVEYEFTFSDGTRIRYRPWDKANDHVYAMQGTVEIAMEGEVTVGRTQAILAHLEELGINASLATADDIEILYLRKQAYILNIDQKAAWQKVEAAYQGKPKSEQVQIMRDFWSRELGVQDVRNLPGYDPIGEYEYSRLTGKANAGRRRQMRFDISDDDVARELPDRHLHMSITGGVDIADVLETMLRNNGSFLANMERVRAGVPLGGMSAGQDFGTGGASYVFTRLTRGTNRGAGIYWKPKLLRRMDAIAYERDEYGRVTGSTVRQKRHATLSALRDKVERGSSNEVILKSCVSVLDNIDLVVVGSPAQRQRVIKAFHDAGITHLPDGRKVDDIVRLG